MKVKAGFPWKSGLEALQRLPEISYYFRYPLHASDFHKLSANGRLLGRFAAKPLYRKLAPDGRVDKTSGFSGEVAILFLPAETRSVRSAKLILSRTNSKKVMLSGGRRNWKAIRQTAKSVLLKKRR